MQPRGSTDGKVMNAVQAGQSASSANCHDPLIHPLLYDASVLSSRATLPLYMARKPAGSFSSIMERYHELGESRRDCYKTSGVEIITTGVETIMKGVEVIMKGVEIIMKGIEIRFVSDLCVLTPCGAYFVGTC